MKRAGYANTIEAFLLESEDAILGRLSGSSNYAVELTQLDAWKSQIAILKSVLGPFRTRGSVYFEFAIPRLGKRIDVVAIVDSVIFVLEFKVRERNFPQHAFDQVHDYGLDLKNFHESSHDCFIAPILIATEARQSPANQIAASHQDQLLQPLGSTVGDLPGLIQSVLEFADAPVIDVPSWEAGRYCPTPTIIEAAIALYGEHGVAEISRSDAGAINLTETSDAISEIIRTSKANSRKSICFVTGVPGAGKTLVGLNIATQNRDKTSKYHCVFLSGNGPLVAVLREALARDKVRRESERQIKIQKGVARSEVKAIIQNVHHFRDECLIDSTRPPVDHVALFDEAQRAWNLEQTVKFMKQKKGRLDFRHSEPEFLISCMDRHKDWATIVCLVGGGQEINTGEAGIGEWIDSLHRSFPDWDLYISSRLTDAEYGAGRVIEQVKALPNVNVREQLHLSVSMRSFRSEKVSQFVKQLLDLDHIEAVKTLRNVDGHFPIVLTRDLARAKQWLRSKARGSERYGIVVSSQAQRLKPHAIDVRSPMNPIHWFLDEKDDVRSSYYLEDVATEFHVQGLELDWACVTWDADFRRLGDCWEHWEFKGSRWNRIRKLQRQTYLKNAYRVLLTRARQGMVIVVPEGDPDDPTRNPSFYNATFEYLQQIGLKLI